MQAVILAGGKAKRLGSLTKKTPKSMILINEKPFLEYQIRLLKRNGIKNIVLCVGHLSEAIRKYFGTGRRFGVSIKYSKDGKKLLGTGGALKRAEKLLNDEFFVMYGDSYLPINFRLVFKKFKKSKKLGLMTVYKNRNKYDKSNVALSGGDVKKYDKNRSRNMEYIDYGLSVLSREALADVKKGKAVSLETILKKLVKEKELAAHKVTKRFYEVGSFSGLEDFEKLVSRLKL